MTRCNMRGQRSTPRPAECLLLHLRPLPKRRRPRCTGNNEMCFSPEVVLQGCRTKCASPGSYDYFLSILSFSNKDKNCTQCTRAGVPFKHVCPYNGPFNPTRPYKDACWCTTKYPQQTLVFHCLSATPRGTSQPSAINAFVGPCKKTDKTADFMNSTTSQLDNLYSISNFGVIGTVQSSAPLTMKVNCIIVYFHKKL